MSFSWERFHSDCRHVSDASIICEDGVIFTHKLVLAAVSELLEQILSDIPAADEVTLYLKTFEKSKVEEFFKDLLHKKDFTNTELCTIFGVNRSFEPLDPLCEQGDTSKLGTEEPRSSSIMKESVDQITKVEVKEERMDDLHILAFESNANITNDVKKNIHAYIDKVTEEKVKEFEKDLIPNPTTKKDFILNQKVNMRVKYEKAIAFFKSGQADSIHHAAVKFGVDFKTIKKLVLNGGSYRGTGGVLKRFSKEEEKVIAERALKISSSVEKGLTYKLLEKVILEEADVIKINQPERADQMNFTTSSIQSFSQALAERNGIKDHVNSIRRNQDNRRIYECEICHSSFTFQNTLIRHRKKIHSFLYQ